MNLVVAVIGTIFIIVAVGALFVGGKMIRWAIRRRRHAPAAIPTAQVVVDAKDPIRPPEETTATADVVGRIIAGATGSALIAGVGYAIYAAYEISQHGLFMDMKMGRPLRLGGLPRLPDVITGGPWGERVTPTLAIDPDERQSLANVWLAAARAEHASIAAFERLSRQLAHHDASHELIQRCRAAADDELRHAQRCFALASAFAGTPLLARPGVPIDLDERIDLATLAAESLVDGCLGEGIAADVAAHGAMSASDPVIQTTLAMITADESRHAELAWDIVGWCIAIGGDTVRSTIVETMTQLEFPVTGLEHVALPSRHGFPGPVALAELAACRSRAVIDRAHARLDEYERAELIRRSSSTGVAREN